MTSLHLITGFLGSGKTTLLKRILSEIGGKIKLAVIQNEFAPTGIDGKELKQVNEHFKLVEINNGSVFCVCQLSNFVETTLQLLNDYKPEIIFLETSGLADPISITELLESKEINDQVHLGNIVTLIDAPNFEKYINLMPRFKHQIMIADKVIVNKMDIFEGDITIIEQGVLQLNPYAEMFFSQYAEVQLDDLYKESKEQGEAAKTASGLSGGRPDWSCLVLRTHKRVSKENLLKFIDTIKQECPRIKGFVNLDSGETVSVQLVFNQTEVKPITDYVGRAELIVFSETLTSNYIRKTFKSFFK